MDRKILNNNNISGTPLKEKSWLSNIPVKRNWLVNSDSNIKSNSLFETIININLDMCDKVNSPNYQSKKDDELLLQSKIVRNKYFFNRTLPYFPFSGWANEKEEIGQKVRNQVVLWNPFWLDNEEKSFKSNFEIVKNNRRTVDLSRKNLIINDFLLDGETISFINNKKDNETLNLSSSNLFSSPHVTLNTSKELVTQSSQDNPSSFTSENILLFSENSLNPLNSDDKNFNFSQVSSSSSAK
jgi:hypothetical protein